MKNKNIEMKDIEDIRSELSRRIQDLQDLLVEEFKTGLLQFFELYPNLESFSWEQGTSSFCDGDPCYFTVDEIHLMEYNGKEYNMYSFGCRTQKEIDEYSWAEQHELCEDAELLAAKTAIMDINNFVSSFDDVLENVYGNGVSIKVMKDKVQVDELDCYSC